jgi:GT2 family glycosyltransferase
MLKRLTIVTTAYRSERYLEHYFAGLAALVNGDEMAVHLVMNDTTERERRIVRQRAGELPMQFIVEEVPRESIGASINRVLFTARTPYVALLDVDDLRVPDAFARQMDVLDRHPEADFTYGDFLIVSSPGSTQGSRVEAPEYDEVEFTRSCLASPTQLFRTSLVRRAGGFDEQMLSGGDYEFQVRSAFSCRFVKTPGLLAYYTKLPGSGSASASRLQPLERTMVELRYGLYDKTVQLRGLPYVQEARSGYRLREVLQRGGWCPLAELVPRYEALIAERREDLLDLERRHAAWRRRHAAAGRVLGVMPPRMRHYSAAAARRLGASWL